MNRRLSCLMLAMFAAGRLAIAQQCVERPPDMVSWYPFDGSFADIAGNNQPTATAALTYQPAMVLNGVRLGNGGFIDVPHSSTLALQQFTIDAWVWPQPTADAFGIVIIGKYRNGSNGVALYWTSGQRFRFQIDNMSANLITSISTFPPNAWYHVAATYNGTTARLFVNGMPQGQKTFAGPINYGTNPNFNWWTIGATPPPLRPVNARRWNGIIDEVEIFNRVLTQPEIQAIFAAGAAGKCKCLTPPPAMRAWYPLDEGAGTAAVHDVAPAPFSSVDNVGTPQPGPIGPVNSATAGPTPLAGRVGGSHYFHSGRFIRVPPHTDLDFGTADFTIDAWIRPVTVSPTHIQPIVDKLTAPNGPGYAFYVSGQRLRLNVNGTTFTSSGPLIPFADPQANSGPWTHVAVRVLHAPGGGIFFINGAPAGTFTPPTSSVNNAVPLWIGKTRVPGRYGEIAVDELELFSRSLAPEQIQAIFNIGAAGKCRPVGDGMQ